MYYTLTSFLVLMCFHIMDLHFKSLSQVVTGGNTRLTTIRFHKTITGEKDWVVIIKQNKHPTIVTSAHQICQPGDERTDPDSTKMRCTSKISYKYNYCL